MELLTDLSFYAAKVVEIAKEAGKKIIEESSSIEIVLKEDGSPVTKADQLSHEIIYSHLTSLTPHIPVFSEEGVKILPEGENLYWLIDPLDGTKSFITGSGEFCVCIALIKDNRPVLGIIYIPSTQETYVGYDQTALRIENEIKYSLVTRAFPSDGGDLLLGGYATRQQYKALEEQYKFKNIHYIKSAIKFCRIAAGEADMYIRFDPCYAWDIAAGQVIVEAAGGKVVNKFGESFVYKDLQLITDGFVVSGK